MVVDLESPKKWYIGGQWTETYGSLDNAFYAVGSVQYEPASQLSIGAILFQNMTLFRVTGNALFTVQGLFLRRQE